MMKYLIEKEFKQFRRNSFMPKLVLFMPCMMMFLLPWAADLETKNVNLVVVDNDHSPYSGRLTEKVVGSPYFNFAGTAPTYDSAIEGIEKDLADVILEIPEGFERELFKENKTTVMISANTVNGTKGMLGSSYLAQITQNFAQEMREESGMLVAGSTTGGPMTLEITPQYRFNQKMNYRIFMIPALMVMLMTLMTGFLPALNIVSEKEIGTIEQINVTPVGKMQFIIAKLVPYWVIGFVVLTICFLIAWLIYGLVPVGSLITIYMIAVIFILVVSGFGIVISNYSATMQQAMFVIFFFLIVFMLLSGLFTPISSMPRWAQIFTWFNPLRYFNEVLRGVYLKGSSFADLGVQVAALTGFAVFANFWAVLSYRKSN